jgi:hypothetical protein
MTIGFSLPVKHELGEVLHVNSGMKIGEPGSPGMN